MKKIFCLIVLLGTLNIQINAWDEVTHAFMTRMIPELVKDQELKKLLQKNLDDFVYGCWFTDTYQYTDNRVNSMNPHIIADYGPAFFNYLQKEDVKKQDNYERLVALYLGSLAHLLEDFWYDSNLNHYQKTKPDGYIGDSKHGAFVVKQHGYLNLKVKRYFPKKDLFNMYKEAGMLQEEFDTPEEFENMFNEWSNQQYLLLRSLKFINFLAGNQMHNQSLWTAGNLRTISGGMENSAEVAAKFVEASWKKLKNETTPLFIHADYFYFDNKIAVLASTPILEKDIAEVALLKSSGDTIQGSFTQFVHPDKKKGITRYAFSFFPEKELTTGEAYRLIINNKSNPFTFDFTPVGNQEKLAEKKPFLSTVGMGIFGLIPMLAIGGLFFGIAGINRVNWSYKHGLRRMPVLKKIFNLLMNLAGYAAIGVGIYLLVTKGALIIDISI